jgi:uncharacterized protein (DUF433 family)
MPEIESVKAPYLYSFRDIVALRTFAWLRGDHPLQMIRKSIDTMKELELVEHPSSYKLIKLGSSIGILDGNQAIDLAKNPGQTTIGTLADVFAEFETVSKRRVDPLLRPREGVEVNPAKLGGWPTITGTRIPFDLVAALVSDGTISPEKVADYYPGVSADAARDALDYQESISGEAA